MNYIIPFVLGIIVGGLGMYFYLNFLRKEK
jgi:hypothetical protein